MEDNKMDTLGNHNQAVTVDISSKVMLSEQCVKHKSGEDETVAVEAEICDFDDLVVNNNDVVLKNIAEDLQNHLPVKAMFNWEHLALQKIHQHPLPMIHVDAFLFDDDFVDSLYEEGKMTEQQTIQLMEDVQTGAAHRPQLFPITNARRLLDRAWKSIACNVRKRWSLLVRVPRLEEFLSKLQMDIELSQLVEEMHLNYDVVMEKEVDREALEQIHLYKIL